MTLAHARSRSDRAASDGVMRELCKVEKNPCRFPQSKLQIRTEVGSSFPVELTFVSLSRLLLSICIVWKGNGGEFQDGLCVCGKGREAEMKVSLKRRLVSN